MSQPLMSEPRSSPVPRYWCVVPAAGVGARMGADVPKQYLPLLHKTILEHTLERMLQLPGLVGMLLALSREDNYWDQLSLSRDARITRVDGGVERSHSVLNALVALSGQAAESDWVLVHDAARPCVTLASVHHLCKQLEQDSLGGILAVPVSDTIKRVDSACQIIQTVDRSNLWQAQTPQLFRYGVLRACLTRSLAEGQQLTDEASAMEYCGYAPRVVAGRSDNIKITRAEDLALATTILQQQGISV